MVIMEISDSKFDKMAEYAEKMLRYGGKLMQFFDESLGEDMGNRDDEEWDDEDEMGNRGGGGGGSRGGGGGMGNRRGVKGTGRYSRIRYR